MVLDGLRDKFDQSISPLLDIMERYNLSPNHLSLISLIAAVFAGFSYYLYSNGSRVYLLIALILVMLNGISDGIDGILARRKKVEGPKGDFIDHVVDRYSDMFIIVGIIFGTGAPPVIGFFAISGVLLTSYLGVQSQAVGQGREYKGILSRADRMVLIIIFTLGNLIFVRDLLGLPLLGWVLVTFAVGSHATALQRIIITLKRL